MQECVSVKVTIRGYTWNPSIVLSIDGPVSAYMTCEPPAQDHASHHASVQTCWHPDRDRGCIKSMFCCCSVFTAGFIPSLHSWCRAKLICPWTFVLCIVCLCHHHRCCRWLSPYSVCLFHVVLQEPTSQSTLPVWIVRFIFGSFLSTKKQSLGCCLLLCLLRLITDSPRGPVGLWRGPNKQQSGKCWVQCWTVFSCRSSNGH